VTVPLTFAVPPESSDVPTFTFALSDCWTAHEKNPPVARISLFWMNQVDAFWATMPRATPSDVEVARIELLLTVTVGLLSPDAGGTPRSGDESNGTNESSW